MHNEVRHLVITGLCHMDFVASPNCTAFDTHPRLRIVGRRNEFGGGRNVVIGTPMDLFVLHPKLLDPDAPQDLHRRDLFQPGHGLLPKHYLEQVPAIPAYLVGQFLLLALLFWKAKVFHPAFIALVPLLGRVGSHPFRYHRSQAIQCCTQCFSHTLQTVDRANVRTALRPVDPCNFP